MNDTAIIISAIAALVTAIGGVIYSFSKCGPAIIAYNKMLNDRIKREKEAKKSPITKQPKETTEATAEDDDIAMMPTLPLWTSIPFLWVPSILITIQPFLSTAVTVPVLVTMIFSAVSMITYTVVSWALLSIRNSQIILRLLFSMSKLQNAQAELNNAQAVLINSSLKKPKD